jgi:hypothetical protein
MAALSVAPLAARAGEADVIRTEITAALDQMFGPAADRSVTYEGLDVEGAAAPYTVAVRGIKLADPEGGGADIGTVTIKIAPRSEGVYDVSDLVLPATVSHHTADGAVDGTLQLGTQSFKGVWSAPLKTFLSMDGNFGDIKALDKTGKTVMTVGATVLQTDSTEKTPGHWDQQGTFKVSDVVIDSDDGVLTIGGADIGSEAHNVDLAALEALMTKIQAWGQQMGEAVPAMPAVGTQAPEAMPEDGSDNAQSGTDAGNASTDQGAASGPAAADGSTGAAADPAAAQAAAMTDLMTTLQNLPPLLADAKSHVELSGLSFVGTDGKKLFDLGKGGFDFGLDGLDQEKAALRIAYHHIGLSGDWSKMAADEESMDDESGDDESGDGSGGEAAAMPEDPQTRALSEGLAPRDLVIDIRLEDIPGKALWGAALQQIGSGAMSQPGAEDQAMAMFAMMAQQMVVQAGSKLRLVDSKYVSKTAQLAVDGLLQADATAPMGATGTINIDLTGLDDVVSLVKANTTGPDAEGATAPLEMLRAFGSRTTAADGTVVDKYVLSLDKTGSLTVNGKDLSFLMNAMGGEQGTGSGEPQAPDMAPDMAPDDGQGGAGDQGGDTQQ